jgi:hypothetical protein
MPENGLSENRFVPLEKVVVISKKRGVVQGHHADDDEK